MKPSFRRVSRKAEKGAAAVEAALVMGFILVPLTGIIFLFGQFFWQYTVVQKAAHDAALYMVSAPLMELKSGAAEGVAAEIISREIAQLNKTTRVEVYAYCGFKVSVNSTFMTYLSCSATGTPAAVRANTVVTIRNPFFDPTIRSRGMQFTIPVTMYYAPR